MSGYVTLGGGDSGSTAINNRHRTDFLEDSVSDRSSSSIDKETIAVGLVREGLAMEYSIIIGVLNSTLTLLYLALQLLLCYPGTTERWIGPVVLLIIAPLFHLLWSIRYRGMHLRKLNAHSMHRATGIVMRESSWESLEIIFQLSCLVIVIVYAVLDLLGQPSAGVVISILSLVTFVRLIYDLQGIHEASLGRVFNSVVVEAWNPLVACLLIFVITTTCGILSAHYIAQQSSVINGLVITLAGFVDGVVCVTAVCSLVHAHSIVIEDAERSRLCINNLVVRSNSLLRDIQLSFKHAMKLNEVTGLTFWQLLRLIDGSSANYRSSASHDVETATVPKSDHARDGEVAFCDDRILGWEIMMDMAGESRGMSLWRYLTEDWAEERLETIAPSPVPRLPIVMAGSAYTGTNDHGLPLPGVVAHASRRQSPEPRMHPRRHPSRPIGPVTTYEESYKKGYSEQLRYQRENSVATTESTPIDGGVKQKSRGGGKKKHHQNSSKKSFLNRLRDANNLPPASTKGAANSPARAVHRPR